MDLFSRSLSDIQSRNIGKNTEIWQYVVILKDAKIGSNCNINAHVFIENDVIIGDNVTIKSGVQVWDGLRIENNAFIGPNVTFTNDLVPRSKMRPKEFEKTTIELGASIGANSTILAGNKIGRYAMIGAGSLITKSVGNYELWVGSPAEHVGFITEEGLILDKDLISKKNNKKFKFENDKLVEVK